MRTYERQTLGLRAICYFTYPYKGADKSCRMQKETPSIYKVVMTKNSFYLIKGHCIMYPWWNDKHFLK